MSAKNPPLQGTLLLRDNVAAGIQLLAGALVLWAVALLVLQAVMWLKTGTWQPVPAYAVFLSPTAQTFHLRLVEGLASPLRLAPSWASFDSLDAVVESIAGSFAGLAQIVRWGLDIALGAWLLAASFACALASEAIAALFPDASVARRDQGAE